jgi:hypothetical protein
MLERLINATPTETLVGALVLYTFLAGTIGGAALCKVWEWWRG